MDLGLTLGVNRTAYCLHVLVTLVAGSTVVKCIVYCGTGPKLVGNPTNYRTAAGYGMACLVRELESTGRLCHRAQCHCYQHLLGGMQVL